MRIKQLFLNIQNKKVYLLLLLIFMLLLTVISTSIVIAQTRLKLQLNLNKETYYLGDTITGTVTVTNPSKQSIQTTLSIKTFKEDLLIRKSTKKVIIPSGTSTFYLRNRGIPNKPYVLGNWKILISADSSSSEDKFTITSKFIGVRGDRLILDGNEYAIKGANYLGGRYIQEYIKDYTWFEHYNIWQIFHNFDTQKIEEELQWLKYFLGVNTIRILTPAESSFRAFVVWHDWEPWFSSKGTISPLYLNRLKQFLDIAERNQIKVVLELFHNIQSREWMCWENGAWVECTRPLSTYQESETSFIPSGSDKETFYLRYLQSLISVLKDHPAILAYEVGNEMLVQSDVNYWQSWGRDWYEARVLSFVKRMITEIRRLDKNHLIVSGEVVTEESHSSAWHWPSAEFALIRDIDNLNSGQPFSLESLVDLVAPHLYKRENFPDISLMLQEIKSRTEKPVALNEFGYLQIDNTLPPPYPEQEELFRQVIAAANQYGYVGYQVWAPFPVFDLATGSFTIERRDPTILLTLLTTPKRKILWYGITWSLAYGGTGYATPAASVFAGRNAAFVSQNVPTTMVAGQKYKVSITMRNTGETAWGPIGPMYYAYRLGAQNPHDNRNWGSNRFELPNTVAPGEKVTINFVVTAPSNPSTYNFQWRMAQEVVEWFGELTPNVVVNVIS